MSTILTHIGSEKLNDPDQADPVSKRQKTTRTFGVYNDVALSTQQVGSLLDCDWKCPMATLEIISVLFVQLAGDCKVVSSG